MAMASGRAFSTLGRRLMDMGQIVGDKRRERQAQEEREREREIAEQRYETSLRLTPGVYEAPPSTTEFIDAPTLNASMPENPFDRPVRDVGLRMPEPVALDMPNFDVMPVTRPNTLQEGHTRLNDRLAFNPNFQRDQAIAEEQRRRDAIIAALGDNPNREAIATGATLGVDLSYRPFTRDELMRDNREVAMTPRWQPPEPDRFDVVTGADGQMYAFNINTGRMEPTGVNAPTTGNGRGPLARTVPNWDQVYEDVRNSDQWSALNDPAKWTAITNAIVNGEEPPTFGAPATATAPTDEGPGLASRLMGRAAGGMGDILRAAREPFTGVQDTSAFNLSASPTTTTEPPTGGMEAVKARAAELADMGLDDDEVTAQLRIEGLIQ